VWVNDRAANSRGLQADIEPNVRSKRCARPSATLGDNQTYGAKGSYRATGARSPDNERETAGLDRGDIARFRNGRSGLGAFQNGEVSGSVAACKSGSDNAAVGQSDLNVFVAAQCVLRGDDDAGAPNDPARRAASLRVNGDDACGGAIGGLRQGVG
jgi:hypothetical protein